LLKWCGEAEVFNFEFLVLSWVEFSGGVGAFSFSLSDFVVKMVRYIRRLSLVARGMKWKDE